jgi:hypothetical protein
MSRPSAEEFFRRLSPSDQASLLEASRAGALSERLVVVMQAYGHEPSEWGYKGSGETYPPSAYMRYITQMAAGTQA